MKDVAKRAGVSPSTVSHVLNGTRRVSPSTREKVLWSVRELEYQPNLLAKGLKTHRTFTIGLLISDIQNPFFTAIVRGVEDVALSRGYHIFLCNTDEDPYRGEEYVVELLKKQVDGLVLASAVPRHDHAQDQGEELPVVFVDREVKGIGVGAFRVNNRLGMRLVAEHLVRLGHERIGLISGPLETTSGLERYEGLWLVLKELGAPLEKSLVRFGDYHTSSGRRGTSELLKLPVPPTALVVANNQMTLGALLAIQEAGVKIPDDISIVGFDDPEWAPIANPPLTAIAQPMYELGARAARALLDKIEGGRDGQWSSRELLEPSLVIRDSTSPPTSESNYWRP